LVEGLERQRFAPTITNGSQYQSPKYL